MTSLSHEAALTLIELVYGTETHPEDIANEVPELSVSEVEDAIEELESAYLVERTVEREPDASYVITETTRRAAPVADKLVDLYYDEDGNRLSSNPTLTITAASAAA